MAWHDEYPHSIYASVLLLDGKIENWKIGGRPKAVYDWTHVWKKNRLNDYKSVYKEFVAHTPEEHNRIFEVDVIEWFKQWPIADDFKGWPPYEIKQNKPVITDVEVYRGEDRE